MGTLGLLVGLQQVIGVHRRGVDIAQDCVDELVPQRWRDDRPADLDPVTHVSRNFFSLLLLTAYRDVCAAAAGRVVVRTLFRVRGEDDLLDLAARHG